jgi:hypothetical protein
MDASSVHMTFTARKPAKDNSPAKRRKPAKRDADKSKRAEREDVPYDVRTVMSEALGWRDPEGAE